jgi:hypothetical protein
MTLLRHPLSGSGSDNGAYRSDRRQAASNQQFNASWVLVNLGLALLFVLYFNRWNARPKPTAEQCAQCGFDLTGKSGPCPQCGGTRRLPKLH